MDVVTLGEALVIFSPAEAGPLRLCIALLSQLVVRKLT